jgi:hypothetical protein
MRELLAIEMTLLETALGNDAPAMPLNSICGHIPTGPGKSAHNQMVSIKVNLRTDRRKGSF